MILHAVHVNNFSVVTNFLSLQQIFFVKFNYIQKIDFIC